MPDDLAVRKAVQLTQLAHEGYEQFGRALAGLLDAALLPVQRAELQDRIAMYTADLEKAFAVVRAQVLEEILTAGETVTENGAKELRYEIDGQPYIKRATPTRKTLDPKKVESLLRARCLEVQKGMNAVVTYEVAPAKVARLVESGELSNEDLERCKYDLAWRVGKLTKVDENNE